jgi:predicted ATP-dependent endonuclease of OLD family
MENILTINNFKRFISEIQLTNFTRVNYFVGTNGSGKSSILNAISYLNDGSNSRQLFHENGKVEFQLGDKKQFIIWQSAAANPNHTSHHGNLDLKIVTSEGYPEKGANGIVKLKFNYDNLIKDQLDFINESFSLINTTKIEAERIINNDDPWDNSVGTRLFKENGKVIIPRFLSQGFQSLNDIRYIITQSLKYIKPEEFEKADALFYIFEEPENNLHPELQKKIPWLFNDILFYLFLHTVHS